MRQDRESLLRTLGDTVRTLRKARGWTRRDLAAATGVSERFLADIETAKANPSLMKICDVAEALDTTPIGLLEAGGNGHADPRTTIIALLGLRGAGKSAVGARLAERLGWPFIELDAEIERATGLELAQIFQLYDEPGFRRAEHDALRGLLVERERPFVLATGGGIVTERSSWDLLRAHARTVWLRARPEEHWARVMSQGDTRPMAEGDERAFAALCAILDQRRSLYELAEFSVETSGRTVDEIAEGLSDTLRVAETTHPELA